MGDMYICDTCCDVRSIDDLPTSVDYYPYGEGFVSKKRIEFDCRCGGEYVPAEICDRCGEYVAETNDGLCDCCYNDMYGEVE